MIPPRRPSIRNIPVAAEHHHVPPHERFDDEQPPHRPAPPRSYALLWWGVGVVAVCAVAGLVLSTLFERATVTVYPKTQSITLPPSVVAQPNAPLGSLSYQTVTVTQTASTTAQATGTQKVSKFATGAIIISNTYSTASQQLTANTRFQASDGKIYRIHAPVTVPGDTKNVDGTIVPGTATAIVYADGAGADYNRTTQTAFTIPGFKGTPRYTRFTAQSQGAISGGFVGTAPAIAITDETAAEATLKQSLTAALQLAAQHAAPSGSIVAQRPVTPTYTDIAETPVGTSNSVVLSQSASEVVVFVSAVDLATFLAKQTVPEYKGESVLFADPSTVELTLPLGGATTGPLTLGLGGSATLVWQFDQNTLIQALLGTSKDAASFERVVQHFQPAIAKAEADVHPFWKGTFPTNPSRITIKLGTQ